MIAGIVGGFLVIAYLAWAGNSYRMSRKPALTKKTWEQVASDPGKFKGRHVKLTLTALGRPILGKSNYDQTMAVGKFQGAADRDLTGNSIQIDGKWIVVLRATSVEDTRFSEGDVIRVQGKITGTTKLTVTSIGGASGSSVDADDYPVIRPEKVTRLNGLFK